MLDKNDISVKIIGMKIDHKKAYRLLFINVNRVLPFLRIDGHLCDKYSLYLFSLYSKYRLSNWPPKYLLSITTGVQRTGPRRGSDPLQRNVRRGLVGSKLLHPAIHGAAPVWWTLNCESVVSTFFVTTDYWDLLGCLSFFLFASCFCLLFFCFWLLSLSFFPPLSPIVYILSFSTIHRTYNSRLLKPRARPNASA